MAVSDGETVTVVKDMGLVTDGLRRAQAGRPPGHLAIGHTRYSTHGSSDWARRPAGLPRRWAGPASPSATTAT